MEYVLHAPIEAYCAFYGKVDHILFDWHVKGKL